MTAINAEPTSFREVLAQFPSGVTIVTAKDAEGRPWGFTASSFCSVSMDPPLVLVCLAKTADCHSAFENANAWNVHIVGKQHEDLAMRFATKGADKFSTGFSSDETGTPMVEDACAVLSCQPYATWDAGDHTVLVGQVTSVRSGPGDPTVYFRRAFRALAERVAS